MFWLITGKKELDRCLEFNSLCHLQNIPWRLNWCISSFWSRGILCTSEFLKKWPFLPSPSTPESIPGRPLPRTRAFLGVFDNSRGVRDYGNFCCAVERIMGKLQNCKGIWESLTWKAKKRLPLFALPMTPCAATATKNPAKKRLVTKEVLSVNTWLIDICIYDVLIFIAFAVNEKKLIFQQFVGYHRSLITNLPEGATQILLQTICNHQILRTIFYFQSAQKWKWILQDH